MINILAKLDDIIKENVQTYELNGLRVIVTKGVPQDTIVLGEGGTCAGCICGCSPGMRSRRTCSICGRVSQRRWLPSEQLWGLRASAKGYRRFDPRIPACPPSSVGKENDHV